MTEIERSEQRSGGTEAERRQDGAGRREPHPAGEQARGNVEPDVAAPEGAEEVWMPGEGTRKTDPANQTSVPLPE